MCMGLRLAFVGSVAIFDTSRSEQSRSEQNRVRLFVACFGGKRACEGGYRISTCRLEAAVETR